MKFEEKEILPYTFPCHNYRNYIQSIKLKNWDFDKNDYYVYLISNPIQSNFEKTINEYSIYVAILVRDKIRKTYSFIEERFDFKSILQLNIFERINDVGDTTPFENLKKEFNEVVYKTKINISDTTKCEILSLEQIVSRFNILKKADVYKLNYFKNLEFYLYHIDGKEFLIPAIEILKYFYLFNYSYQYEPKSHFCQDILTPNGILNALNFYNYDAIKKHYDLEINGNYSENDLYKILFFLTNKKRLQLYSNVEKNYKKTNVISAMFPRKDLEFTARIIDFNYRKIDLYLVLNIVTHDFDYNKEFPQKFSCVFSHSKSQFPEENKGIRNSSKDIKKKIRKNIDLETNDKLYGNSKLEYEEETINNFKLNIVSEKASAIFKMDIKKKIIKQKEQKGARKKKDYSNLENTPLTTKENRGSTDCAISTVQINDKNENELNKSYLNINEILKYIKNSRDFIKLDEKLYKFPESTNNKGIEIKSSIMFLDIQKKIRREYCIVKIKYKNEKDIYIVELQKKDNEQKSILIILKNDMEIEIINNKIIIDELIDLSKYGNRAWLLKNIFLNENEYFTLPHRGSAESFIDKLVDKLRID